MISLKHVLSKSRNRFIDVIKSEDGSYMLQQYVIKYDPEEDLSYKVRELPRPTGKYGDLESAINEAERLMQQN